MVVAVVWLVVFACSLAVSEAVGPASGDAMSLLGFKSSVSADPGGLLSGWNGSTSPCAWRGVTCDASSGRVVALSVGGSLSRLGFPREDSYLAGELPEAVGDLSELRTLSIPYNAFSGQIPASIGKLRFLEVLELQGNNFSGGIPVQIRYHPFLRLVDLSCNSLSGSIPSGLIGYGRLAAVDLSTNQLSGGIEVDKRSDCKLLRYLKLSNNFLVNNIPPEIGKCINMRTLLLDGNILEGRIPPEIGNIAALRVLDVSRNSLVDRIPIELSNCRNLSVIVLTNLVDYSSSSNGSLDSLRGEFNAFAGGIPHEIFLLPSLQILWAPRANLGGRLPSDWGESCSLRVLNLGQNYFAGVLPEGMGVCRKLSFLDVSSNNLMGPLPSQLQIPCMVYFNVSLNNLTGVLPKFLQGSCTANAIFSEESVNAEDLQNSNLVIWTSRMGISSRSDVNGTSAVVHDFSRNNFVGPLPQFVLGDEFLGTDRRSSYRLLLNDNKFNGSFPVNLISNCSHLLSFSVNLSANLIESTVDEVSLLDCEGLSEFVAADNQISGPISPNIANFMMLQFLDIRRNRLHGSLPGQLGNLKNLKWMLLGGNNLTGEIPSQLGQLTSLTFLDLSQNALTGSIPANLTNALNLVSLLLDHNSLSGEIPQSFSALPNLVTLDLSFNNLSGHIPHVQHQSDCSSFRENIHLLPCPDSYVTPPAGLPVPLEVKRSHGPKKRKPLIIALVTSAAIILSVLIILVLVLVLGRRKLRRLTSLRRKVVVTFADVPAEVNYDSVVRATENFSIRYLIGTGGFGSTYKAELVPGFLVAVKRLSVGRFQGIQQFDAEISTLGRIRHKNLVTLIGYYVGETEMFLIYNYLSGGNLEAFIHQRSGENVKWPVIHKIALDVAQALAYLHYSCSPRIVHRDIKPSNILLDKELNAYLSDFGLARLLEVSETHATTDVAGTFGYVAPEYATTCRVSDKADVYSFGVVLLELMSGKRSIDPSFSEFGNGFNIVAWARFLIMEGRSSELFSTELREAGPLENLLGMLRLASVCTAESLSVRPSMKQVVEKLKQLKS
ncbi:LRR receptor-like serine/threonine-protein kinase RPK2 [Syzygium oleosum]|uniref:LRR receptor-like serine/threonine-protein kinase RPK2 n=1 Tax=Syzygium oleosum TaxID=219896 RepID=UPI0024BBADE3|nr:LRR receptor-like serine/threonine-protein kinase RPK2 [Syzygium oleosum]